MLMPKKNQTQSEGIQTGISEKESLLTDTLKWDQWPYRYSGPILLRPKR